MPIRFRCQHCQQFLGIARRKAGQNVRCPTCRRDVLVPQEDEEAASPVPPPGPAQPAPVGSPSPLYERSDFDALLQGESEAPARPAERSAPVKAPPPGRVGATMRSHAAGFDVEPVPDAPWPLPIPPPSGVTLSSHQVTLLAVLAVVLLAVAFAGGVLVGRFLL